MLALTVLSAIAQAFDGATRQTVFPRLVPRRAIVSAIGLNSMSFNVAQFIGPMIGGLLIGPIGVGGLMLCNALSFVALIYAIFVSSPLGGAASGPTLSPLHSLKESFRFVWDEPTVGWCDAAVVVRQSAGASLPDAVSRVRARRAQRRRRRPVVSS